MSKFAVQSDKQATVKSQKSFGREFMRRGRPFIETVTKTTETTTNVSGIGDDLVQERVSVVTTRTLVRAKATSATSTTATSTTQPATSEAPMMHSVPTGGREVRIPVFEASPPPSPASNVPSPPLPFTPVPVATSPSAGTGAPQVVPIYPPASAPAGVLQAPPLPFTPVLAAVGPATGQQASLEAPTTAQTRLPAPPLPFLPARAALAPRVADGHAAAMPLPGPPLPMTPVRISGPTGEGVAPPVQPGIGAEVAPKLYYVPTEDPVPTRDAQLG